MHKYARQSKQLPPLKPPNYSLIYNYKDIIHQQWVSQANTVQDCLLSSFRYHVVTREKRDMKKLLFDTAEALYHIPLYCSYNNYKNP